MVGKEIRINRDNKGRFTKRLNWKIPFGLLMLAGLLSIANYGLEKYIAWRHEWDVLYKFPLELRTHKMVDVVKRPEPEYISPIVVVEEADIEISDPIDQKIHDLWGDKYFLMARSIFKCESGLNPEAVNWTTQDLGVAQINWPTWKDKIAEKFGYTLKDMFDYEKNLEVAYWIWDRGDGEEGNGQGTFKPWVVFNNGNFIGCVE